MAYTQTFSVCLKNSLKMSTTSLNEMKKEKEIFPLQIWLVNLAIETRLCVYYRTWRLHSIHFFAKPNLTKNKQINKHRKQTFTLAKDELTLLFSIKFGLRKCSITTLTKSTKTNRNTMCSPQKAKLWLFRVFEKNGYSRFLIKFLSKVSCLEERK